MHCTSPGLGVVLEHLERVLLPGGLLRALDHLPVDAQAEDVGGDDVVVDERGGLDLEPGAGGAYHGQEQLVNGGQPLLGGLLHLAAAATEGGGSAGAARLQHKKVSKMSDNRRSPENNSRGKNFFFLGRSRSGRSTPIDSTVEALFRRFSKQRKKN